MKPYKKIVLVSAVMLICFLCAGCFQQSGTEGKANTLEENYVDVENATYKEKEAVLQINNKKYSISIPSDFEVTKLDADNYIIESVEKGDQIEIGDKIGWSNLEYYFSIDDESSYDPTLESVVLTDLFKQKTESYENYINTSSNAFTGDNFEYEWYQGKYGKIVQIKYNPILSESSEWPSQEVVIEYYCRPVGCNLYFRAGGSSKIASDSPVVSKYEDVMLHVADSIHIVE